MWVVYNKDTMKDYELFQAALGLGNEWFVVKSDFNQDEKRLDIYLDFERGLKVSPHAYITLVLS